MALLNKDVFKYIEEINENLPILDKNSEIKEFFINRNDLNTKLNLSPQDIEIKKIKNYLYSVFFLDNSFLEKNPAYIINDRGFIVFDCFSLLQNKFYSDFLKKLNITEHVKNDQFFFTINDKSISNFDIFHMLSIYIFINSLDERGKNIRKGDLANLMLDKGLVPLNIRQNFPDSLFLETYSLDQKSCLRFFLISDSIDNVHNSIFENIIA